MPRNGCSRCDCLEFLDFYYETGVLYAPSALRYAIIGSQNGVCILENQLSCSMSRRQRSYELWIIYDVNIKIIMNIQTALMTTLKSF